MSRTSLSPDALRDQTESLNSLDKPTIRVLIYTDDPNKIQENGNFGIRELRRQLAAHPPAFANIDLRPVVSRNSGPNINQHADRTLDHELDQNQATPYHEVWFFGLHQINKDEYRFEFPGGGGPRSELNAAEVAALTRWMSVDPADGSKGIGVLMSGDHANPPPDQQPISGATKFCPPGLDHQTFLSLGRALGINVPRAKFLRVWQGPPTHCEEDSFNTLFPPPNEIDASPQQLNLPRFDQYGNPNPAGEPHNVFRGKNGEWIQVLPDHEHEGAVFVPKDFPEDVWPSTGKIQPVPKYIAFGTDHRSGRSLKLLAAYDGHAVGLGRIISDSSWHHYLNFNLQSLGADDLGVQAADQIGQFYSNLVVWLAPPQVRTSMTNAMFTWLATHPRMIEEISAGPLNIGNLALRLLRQVATDCEINELLVAACPEDLRRKSETFIFPHEPVVSELPTVEVLIGSIIGKYFEHLAGQDEGKKVTEEQLASIIHNGFAHAFLLNAYSAATQLYGSLSILSGFVQKQLPSDLLSIFQVMQTVNLEKENLTMASTRTDYQFEITLDSNGDTESFSLELNEECLGLPICRLWGELRSGSSEVFTVQGFRVANLMHFEIGFRRVKIVMGGVRRGNDDLFMRWVAVEPDGALARIPEMVAINPDVGETGTGTGNQTFI